MSAHMCSDCGLRLTRHQYCEECRAKRLKQQQVQAAMEVVRAIDAYQTQHRRPPTVRELCVILNLRSTATIQTRINRAVAWGLLEREPGSVRSLRVPLGMIS